MEAGVHDLIGEDDGVLYSESLVADIDELGYSLLSERLVRAELKPALRILGKLLAVSVGHLIRRIDEIIGKSLRQDERKHCAADGGYAEAGVLLKCPVRQLLVVGNAALDACIE